MGNGIAHCFAQKGFNVSIFDISKENLTKAEANISKNLDRMIKKEKISELEKKNILSRITFLNEKLIILIAFDFLFLLFS